MQEIKQTVKKHQFYKDLKLDTVAKHENRTRNMALNYYHFLIEIASRYFNDKKRMFDKSKFISLVFTSVDPKISQDDIDKLFFHLSYEEKMSLYFHLNFYLHTLKTKSVVSGLDSDTLALDMIKKNIVNQKDFLLKASEFIDRMYLHDIKDVKAYDIKKEKIESAMQDLLFGRLLKSGSEVDDSQSVSSKSASLSSRTMESKFTKKELIEKLRECEEKLLRYK